MEFYITDGVYFWVIFVVSSAAVWHGRNRVILSRLQLHNLYEQHGGATLNIDVIVTLSTRPTFHFVHLIKYDLPVWTSYARRVVDYAVLSGSHDVQLSFVTSQLPRVSATESGKESYLISFMSCYTRHKDSK